MQERRSLAEAERSLKGFEISNSGLTFDLSGHLSCRNLDLLGLEQSVPCPVSKTDASVSAEKLLISNLAVFFLLLTPQVITFKNCEEFLFELGTTDFEFVAVKITVSELGVVLVQASPLQQVSLLKTVQIVVSQNFLGLAQLLGLETMQNHCIKRQPNHDLCPP